MFHYFEKANKGYIKILNDMENSQISLYCRFNKIMKWSGTSFQSPALNQKHIRNVCHTAH